MPNVDADDAGRRTRLAIVIVVVVVALDQATKAWAAAELASRPISIIGNDVELRLSRNAGGAFSLFRGFTPLLAVIAVVIAVVLVRAARRAQDRMTLVTLALVLGGALGNLADRVFRAPGFLSGQVVDFVRVGSWPTFNVADSAITTGAVALVVTALLSNRRAA